MEKKLVFRSELAAHTKDGIGYITRNYLAKKEDALLIKEESKVVEGEEIRYCFNCSCEWLNILLEGKVIYSTKKMNESNISEPLEERPKSVADQCVTCGSNDSEVIRKTDFLDEIDEINSTD